ncbi:hypothetical protein LPJ61_002708 [Coemansia biformis]|uniref:Uncharacterized protein n=1 Tax=Coemansia biformis TaxID=1286918 RepID=A0A9W7YE97_9FUNG|nr:hypothetical protein LPJ61_002708 [Coemansia biformis]
MSGELPIGIRTTAVEAGKAGDTAPGACDMVQGLSDAAQTIGLSLQVMQRALVGNMEQAAQLTLSMNRMMEELVKRSVHVGVFARRSSEAPRDATGYRTGLAVTIKNGSPVPLQGAHVKLWFAPRRSQLAHPIQAQLALAEDCACGIALGPSSGGLSDDGCGPESEPFVQTTQGVDLASGATAEALAVLSVDALEQLSGRIAVEFPSPGTGQLLRVEHRFGIHLLQLTTGSFIRADAATDTAALVPVDGARPVDVELGGARDLFAVPPADGIGHGCVLAVGVGGSLLGLRVRDVHADAPTATCEWVAAAGALPELLELVPRLAEELRVHPPPASGR